MQCGPRCDVAPSEEPPGDEGGSRKARRRVEEQPNRELVFHAVPLLECAGAATGSDEPSQLALGQEA
jgi:hypothetical protein